MGLLDKLKFSLWNEVSAVTDLIDRWKPRGCKDEKDFEKSLVTHIRNHLPDIAVTPQYAVGRTKADLVVDSQVIVEMKHNLRTTGQYQRLVGQLTEYGTWKGRVVILLIGETDLDLRHKVQQFINGENSKSEHLMQGLQGGKFVLWDK